MMARGVSRRGPDLLFGVVTNTVNVKLLGHLLNLSVGERGHALGDMSRTLLLLEGSGEDDVDGLESATLCLRVEEVDDGWRVELSISDSGDGSAQALARSSRMKRALAQAKMRKVPQVIEAVMTGVT